MNNAERLALQNESLEQVTIKELETKDPSKLSNKKDQWDQTKVD